MSDGLEINGSLRARWHAAKTTLANHSIALIVFAMADKRVIAAIADAGTADFEYQIIGPDGAGIRGSFRSEPRDRQGVVDCIEDRLLALGWKIDQRTGEFSK